MSQMQPWAIGTAAKALRQVATEMGYTLSDTLCALIIGQLVGAEGAMPGMQTSLGGTNNIGATQVTKPWWTSHQGKAGWGAFAHKDSDPNKGTYLGFYQIAPTPIDAIRSWLAGNWWGKRLLSQNPSDATSYAAILYRGHYFGGVHKGDHNHNGQDDRGNADATAQAAYDANVSDYAAAIKRGMPSVDALNGTSIDPSTITVDPSSFAELSARGITEDLYKKAKSGGMGSAWAFLLPATWNDLVASKGAVWAGAAPSGAGTPGSPSGGGFVAGDLLWLAIPIAIGLAVAAGSRA
jgi:hypothetical protein